ncbi:glycosyltransferase family 20-domain-containing protein [Fimicolochytrium jonesii]|uniref:glycosyltransferase family 20-domain-containing protein n=1 Tax=Fimicolochytrium jonesii TaxID=1396493 RepID=UPI0022FDC106|nr:glycosyltransferase family 20-domain-containing protein [Fimicolochytrium jonesii]KAI8822643.1 glycosyltransferase family 20-domain-containing protein [Fimicolochytrium jonesii]
MAATAEPISLFFMEDETEDEEDEDPSEAEDPDLLSPQGGLQRRMGGNIDGPRTIVASLFLPYTVSSVPVPPAPAAQLERRRSVGAVEFKRQRKASESRGLRPDPTWWHVEPSGLGNIGLQNALNSMKGKINPIWVGSLGVSTDAWSSDTLAHVRDNMKNEKHCVPVYLTDEEVEGHYNQFCKQVLWKPFHYQLPDYPKGPAYEKKAWELYVAVNEKFAQAIVESYRPGDIVWINDYHLMLVPSILRKQLPNAIIAFFLHIPFPSSEIFRCFHVRKQILEGMLGADMIGFQTYPFMRHFLMTCTRLLRLESTPRGVQLDDRTVSVMPIPIGIDLAALNEKRRNPEVAEIIASLKERYAGMKVLLGRDKNDYVKGVRQKLLAFERFLQDYPEWVGKVVLLQVALSTTEANENECRVSDVVARVNSRYGSIEYHPVVYLQQDISFSHYLALWTIADACVITSLRDGMNLTSHEFVVCQEENHGPLIISEFAGTYGSFGSALRVNPWDIREVAEAMHDALVMSEEEKAWRWKELYTHVVGNTAQTFVESFTSELIKAHEEVARTVSTSIPPLPENLVLTEYAHSRKRVFLLDQDGTIMNFNKHSSSTLLSSRIPTEHVTALVQKLASDRRNMVYIMSGRCKSEMEDFNGIPNVGLCAENGCFLKYANRNTWETMLPDQDLSWRKQVQEIFEYYTDRTPGSYIEQKEIGMVWHYGHADMSFGSWQAAECQNHLEQALTKSFAIHVLSKKRSLEVMPRNVNKGTVIRRVLEHHQGRGPQSRRMKSVGSVTGRAARDRNISGGSTTSNGQGVENTEEYIAELEALEAEELAMLPTRERVDFIMCVGDDRADEYMFEYLRRLELHSNSKDRCRSDPSTPFEELRSMMFSPPTTSANPTAVISPGSVTDDPATPLTSPPEIPQDSPSSPGAIPMRGDHNAHFPASLPADFNLHMPATVPGATAQSQPSCSQQFIPSNPASTRSKRCIVTATVGKKGSAAKWFMPGPQEVLTLLEKFIALEKTHKRARNTVPEHGNLHQV